MVVPYFLRAEQKTLISTVLDSGYVLQSTVYNCWPASATALRQLGVEASEGEIAILA